MKRDNSGKGVAPSTVKNNNLRKNSQAVPMSIPPSLAEEKDHVLRNLSIISTLPQFYEKNI